MGGRYVFDIETNGFVETGTVIHCMVAIEVDTHEVFLFNPINIHEGIELLRNADELIGHNIIKFDIPFIEKVVPDFKTNAKLTDTLILSRVIYSNLKDLDFTMFEKNKSYELPKRLIGSHGLEAWGYRMGEHKGEFGKDTDWQTYTPDMLEYCEQDGHVNVKLWKKLIQNRHYEAGWSEIEHRFARIICNQELHGWSFDEEAASELYSELVAKRVSIKEQMSELFVGWWEDMKTPKEYLVTAGSETYSAPTKGALKSLLKSKISDATVRKALESRIEPGAMKQKHTPFNPGSRQHIHRVFHEKYNWKPKVFTKTGIPKIDDVVLQSLNYPEAALLAEYFLLDKRIGQIAEGKQAWLRLVRDGRIHGSVNTGGAVTGRCTHSRPNVAQTPSNDAPYGKRCRSLFRATPGMKLVGADASGLELRCLAHYMAHWDNGEYAKVLLEGDVHSMNQKAAGLPTRANAKTFIYGFLYGAGDAKIGEIVGGSRKAGALLRARFLKTLPALDNLVKSVKRAASKGYVKGLDGRVLFVRSEHSALNTLLQGCGAIVMKYALIRAYDLLVDKHGLKLNDDFSFVGNIHDEIQAETKPEHAELVGQMIVEGIRNATDHFNFKCPLDGEYKIGDTWRETH